jgi:hypothetical protein
MWSRRDVVMGGIGLAGAVAAGATLPLGGRAQALPVRRDITTVPLDQVAKIEAAIKEMQDRSAADPGDPRGWLVHARAHADFCSVGIVDPQQIHFCWWFLPWHRAYLAVTERKLREIAGDPGLAFPYWNWSSDRHIPPAFARAGSALADAVRFTPPRGLEDGEVGYFPDVPAAEALGVAALGAPVFQAQTPAQIRRSFGGIARPNPADSYGNNAIEGTPHGPVHVYVGGQSDAGQAGDMTDFETAARDPIFFAHHGNLDRLWETWRQDATHIGSEPTSNAFLAHRFVFTWLDGSTMDVLVSDTLDTMKLGYTYDTLAVFRPNAPILVASAQGAGARLPPVATGEVHAPVTAEEAGGEKRAILEITDVEPPTRPITVGIFLKPEGASVDDPGLNIGTFAAVLTGGKVAWPSRTLSFDVTDAVNRFAGRKLTVELVPFRIQAQGAESYPPLHYGQMRIITEAQ